MFQKLLQKKLLKKTLATNLLPPKYIKSLNLLRTSSKPGKEGENVLLHGGLFIRFLSHKFWCTRLVYEPSIKHGIVWQEMQ